MVSYIYLGGKSENVDVTLLATFPVGQTICVPTPSSAPSPRGRPRPPRATQASQPHTFCMAGRCAQCMATGGQQPQSASVLSLPQIQTQMQEVPSPTALLLL